MAQRINRHSAQRRIGSRLCTVHVKGGSRGAEQIAGTTYIHLDGSAAAMPGKEATWTGIR